MMKPHDLSNEVVHREEAMLLKYFGIVSMIVLMIISNSYRAEAQRLDAARRNTDLATRRMRNVALEGQLGYLITSLSLDYDIPLGVESSTNEKLSNRYRLEIRNGTVADLMNQFISQNEEYAWSIEDGVVNIFPRDKYRDAFLVELLNVRIGSFTVNKDSDCWKLQDDLINVPEIRAVIDANGMKNGTNFSGWYIPRLGQNFSLQASEISLKVLLNRIVRESTLARTWIVGIDKPSQSVTLGVTARQFEKSQ